MLGRITIWGLFSACISGAANRHAEHPHQAYSVSRRRHALQWAVASPGLPAVMTVEPEASAPQRAISCLVELLPIQAYL